VQLSLPYVTYATFIFDKHNLRLAQQRSHWDFGPTLSLMCSRLFTVFMALHFSNAKMMHCTHAAHVAHISRPFGWWAGCVGLAVCGQNGVGLRGCGAVKTCT